MEIIGEEWDVLGLHDIGCEEDVPETQMTIEGNSRQKAEWVCAHYGVDCFSDDTGLEVEALNGEPGVRSARYAGEQHDMKANLKLLMKKMDGVENRRARFRTVVTLVQNGKVIQFEGVVNGTIGKDLKGDNGFGYDPVFIPEGGNRTFAEMTDEEKNAISHRGKAMQKLKAYLDAQKKTGI